MRRGAGLRVILSTICLCALLSIVSFAEGTEEEKIGPGYVNGIPLSEWAAQETEKTKKAAKTEKSAKDTPIGETETEESLLYEKGELQGNFQIVGYYGAGYTYSGAYTVANHTVAADPSVLPLGTKIFIGKTVYTVEDIGSGVKGKMIDIYFDSYEEAANVTYSGRRYADVYLAVPKKA